jgi:hypothetical protein
MLYLFVTKPDELSCLDTRLYFWDMVNSAMQFEVTTYVDAYILISKNLWVSL